LIAWKKTYCLLNWEGFQTKMLSIYLELGTIILNLNF